MNIKPILLTTAAAIVFAACGGGGATPVPASQAPAATPAPSEAPSDAPSTEPGPSAATVMTDTAAADLRTQLDLKLGAHIIFASKVTGAALGGRADEFAAYGGLLNTNGTDLGAMIGSVYGADAETQFNLIWSAHNGFFVDYTTGVAKKDQAMQDKAVQDLTTVYVPDFAEFLAGATDLPVDVLTTLITDHVLTTKAIVDAQATEDWTAIAAADLTAADHMQMIGDPLAAAIVAKLPAEFN